MSTLIDNQKVQYRVRIYRGTNEHADLGEVTHDVTVDGDNAEIRCETVLQGLKEISAVRLSSRDLGPRSFQSHIETAAATVDVTAEFHNKKVTGLAKTGNGEQQFALNVPAGCHENSSSPYVLRAIALGGIPNSPIHLINLASGTVPRAELRVNKDPEPVETPWITTPCVRVELRLPDVPGLPPQWFSYSADAPNLPVKVVCGPQVMELVHATFASLEQTPATDGGDACSR